MLVKNIAHGVVCVGVPACITYQADLILTLA